MSARRKTLGEAQVPFAPALRHGKAVPALHPTNPAAVLTSPSLRVSGASVAIHAFSSCSHHQTAAARPRRSILPWRAAEWLLIQKQSEALSGRQARGYHRAEPCEREAEDSRRSASPLRPRAQPRQSRAFASTTPNPISHFVTDSSAAVLTTPSHCEREARGNLLHYQRGRTPSPRVMSFCFFNSVSVLPFTTKGQGPLASSLRYGKAASSLHPRNPISHFATDASGALLTKMLSLRVSGASVAIYFTTKGRRPSASAPSPPRAAPAQARLRASPTTNPAAVLTSPSLRATAKPRLRHPVFASQHPQRRTSPLRGEMGGVEVVERTWNLFPRERGGRGCSAEGTENPCNIFWWRCRESNPGPESKWRVVFMFSFF